MQLNAVARITWSCIFALFIIVSSKLLCNLLHCELRIALDCMQFYHLSVHSHTPDLVNYCATYCYCSAQNMDVSSKCLSLLSSPEHQLTHQIFKLPMHYLVHSYGLSGVILSTIYLVLLHTRPLTLPQMC